MKDKRWIYYLAAKRAVDIRFLEASITGSTIVSRPFKLPILRSLLDEHHLGAINRIGLKQINFTQCDRSVSVYIELKTSNYIYIINKRPEFSIWIELSRGCTNLNIGTVYELLEVFQSDNIMIYITTNLNKPMEAMEVQAMRANTGATIQTKDVFLILLCSFMNWAAHEEFLGVEGFQPCWLLNSL